MITYIGWGVQEWGPSPWGGSVITDQPQPPQIGDFERWERVYREPRFKHEPEYIRNVLFKVDGVEALARVGKVTCGGWHRDIRARVGAARYLQCGIGAVEILTGTGTWARAEAISAVACECGDVEAEAGVHCEVDGVESEADVGRTKVRGIHNPTDEELLMMIAEML